MDQDSFHAINTALRAAANLKLVPPVCTGSFEGSRTGSKTGGSMEFADYRSYREGDELRRVDWRLYARSEQLMVRRFAQESDPRCDIIIDCSRSMDHYGKKAAAAGMAALFAQSAVNAGFSLQVWGIHDTLLKMTTPETPELWELPEKGGGENMGLFCELCPELFRNGVRIFISDLFFDLTPGGLMKFLGGSNAVIIQIIGEEEQTPHLSGSVTVTDPESGMSKVLHVDGSALERYRERLNRFRSEYAETVRAHNSCIFFFNASDCLKDPEPFCREGILQ